MKSPFLLYRSGFLKYENLKDFSTRLFRLVVSRLKKSYPGNLEMARKDGGSIFGFGLGLGFGFFCFVLFLFWRGEMFKIAFSIFTKHYLYFYQSANRLNT